MPLGAYPPAWGSLGKAQRNETSCTPAHVSFGGRNRHLPSRVGRGFHRHGVHQGDCWEVTQTAQERKLGIGTPLPKSHHPSVMVS